MLVNRLKILSLPKLWGMPLDLFDIYIYWLLLFVFVCLLICSIETIFLCFCCSFPVCVACKSYFTHGIKLTRDICIRLALESTSKWSRLGVASN